MPDPITGESREDWMARCVPDVIEEGYDQDQAIAICASRWEERGMTHQKSFVAPMEIKAVEDNGQFEGYGSVFGVQDYDGDVVVKGAFKRTLEEQRAANRMPKMLWQHSPTDIVGRWMDMYEDERGLKVKGKLIMDTQRGKEAYALMKEGVLDGMSIGFNVREAVPSEQRSMGRVIEDVDLWEVSLVTWGANPDARVTAVKARQTERQFERFLRESGFSRAEALAITAKGFKGLETQRDSDDAEASDQLAALVDSLGSFRNSITKGI